MASQQQPRSSPFKHVGEAYADLHSLWLPILGDHVHHCYYEAEDVQHAEEEDDADKLSALAQEASVRMVAEVLLWANLSATLFSGGGKILDVGMGLGGVSRYLASKFEKASVEGFSLSPEEVEMANTLTASQNLTNRVSFKVADAMVMPFPSNEYELVWCMECADHISDRKKFMQELVRVTAPGGRIVLTTMCHRELSPEEASLSASDQETLGKIFSSNDIHLAPWSPPSLYVSLAHDVGLKDIRMDNWTKHVASSVPIWTRLVDISYANKSVVIRGLLEDLASVHKCFAEGLIQFIVFTATKASA